MIKHRRSQRALALILFLGAAAFSAPAAEPPAKQAATARFDLSADAQVGAIERGQITQGNGSVERKNWVSEAEQPLGYTVNFAVTHLGWRSLAVRFVPKKSGTVSLTLMGPYEAASSGGLYRQEVLWDNLRAEGATLSDGGFEARPGRKASVWQNGGGVIETQTTAHVAAVEGTHYARTWHNQTLSTSMRVVGGQPVVLHVHARAVRVGTLADMKPIASQSTPAHVAARRFLRGANFGNGLEAPPGMDWGGHYGPEDLRLMRKEGFDHVRIPVGWHHYTGPGPGYQIKPEFFRRVDQLVDAGLREGLAVLINIHHFDDFTTDPAKQTPRFQAIWRQIATHYKNAPAALAFELLNEPKDAATTEVINPIFAETIKVIRQVDPERTIFVGPGRWNNISELPELRLPDDDQNLIVTVHSYEPFYFTHQGATWSGPDTKVTGIRFPGPPDKPLVPDPKLKINSWVHKWIDDYNTEPTATNPSSPHVIEMLINTAKEWSDYYGRPIHIGEFGCFTTADPVSRANYYRAVRESAENAGMGWCIWDWKAGFHYWNAQKNQPESGMREALFGHATQARSQ